MFTPFFFHLTFCYIRTEHSLTCCDPEFSESFESGSWSYPNHDCVGLSFKYGEKYIFFLFINDPLSDTL